MNTKIAKPVIYLLLISALLVQLYTTVLQRINPDVYFLINNGNHILETGNLFPTIAFSTLHEGLDVVLQQPLYSLIIALFFKVLGIRGIVIFAMICLILAAALLYLLAKPLKGTMLLGFVSASFCLMPFVFIGRPFMVTCLHFLISANILERVKEHKISDNYLFILFPVSILELLSHAAFYPLILLFFTCYLVRKNDITDTRDMYYKLKIVLVVLASFAVSFATPYRTKLPLYLFYSYESAAGSALSISELKAPPIFSLYGLYAFLMIVLLIYMTRKADGVHYLLTFFGFCFLMLHTRNYMIATLFVLPLFKDLCMYIETEGILKDCHIRQQAVGIFVSLTMLAAGIIITVDYPKYAIADNSYTPLRAVKYLDEQDHVVLYNGFNQGAFLEFMGYDTYIDARPELYTKQLCGKDILDEYLHIKTDAGFDYAGFISRYGFTHLLLDKHSLFFVYLDNSPGFEKIIDYQKYALFEVKE